MSYQQEGLLFWHTLYMYDLLLFCQGCYAFISISLYVC